ncbi:TonB-dependent receptor [Sphingomonas baiyangensis]|uniref:TonB-dependent receptor n=1 Tax=Sphingomonas baiyangensis TaxID=2572576 RepID=A0A4U1L3P1_9SPHN|nr:TonB-dependent receptor [Sphingomonas baiyangensis]TKD50745.1 TonB-dependent receptor [Sphingomonas baiyangensis]
MSKRAVSNNIVSIRMATSVASGALALALATPAIAQEAGPAAETATAAEAPPQDAQEAAAGEIIVTAQRREQSIQDVPIAITAITAEALQENNVQSVEDFFALTPNVSFQSNGSRDRKDLAIRGISNQLNPYADVRQATYAFYIDEFNVASGTSNPQIVDLERIEVLRGPQGTYFGRNSVGGAINVVTKKPNDEFEGFVDLGYSSFDTYRAEGAVNVPVVEGLLALRASGKYEKSDGFIKNINAIGGGNDSEYYTYRIQGRLTPTDNLTLDVTYNYSDEVVGMRNGVPTGFVTRTWASVYYGRAAGLIGNPDGVGFYPENDDRVNFNRPQRVGGKFEYLSGRAVWEIGDVSVTAVGGHLTATVFNYGDVDGGSPDFFYEDLFLQRESTSGELRVQSTGTNFFDWSVGITAGRDTGVSDQSTFHGADSPLCPASTGGDCEGLEVTGADGRSSSDYWAVFGQGTFNLTDRLAATFGIRYSRETVQNDSVTRSNTILTGVNDRQAKFEDVSPKFTLSYQANPDWLIFATAARGFKSGGTQTSNNVNLLNEFQPETLWNYEAGTKFELFDKKLRVDVTAFYMDWKDVQQTIRFQFIDPATGLLRGVSGIANAAAAESYGLEASFDARLTPQFTFSGQLGWNKTQFLDYPNALIDGVVIDVTGEQLVNAPEWTFGAQAQYNVPITGDFEGFARAEWSFRDTMVSNPYAYLYPVFPFISPSYHNVNLRIGVEDDRFRATVFVENVFDEQFYANAYEKAFYSGVQVEPSTRVFGATLGYKF